jgi:glycosyltransferase involved in cell wall biosynthesis
MKDSNDKTASHKAPMRIAYLMSRFPKITETFVLYEMLAVKDLGHAVDVYPLWRERTKVMHAEAKPFVEQAHFQPTISTAILISNLIALWRQPRVYLGALLTSLWATMGSPRYFIGVLAIFPKVVYFAEQMVSDGVSHVHAHFASHPAAAAFIIGRLTGIPYSFTAHGSDLHRDRHMLREKVAEAKLVVAISEYNRGVILRECGAQFRDRVCVIHCGVEPNAFFPRRPEPSNQKREISICCTGTLHEVKGHYYLVEACQLLVDRDICFHLNLIGDGPDKTALLDQVEQAGLNGRVTFHGRKTREQVAALLQQADIAALPSVPTADGRREGIPVALMEAMATGLAVVASNLSGIPELVEHDHTGLLVEPRDVIALADALGQLARDEPLRRRLGEAARERVLRDFDLRKNARKLASRINGDAPACDVGCALAPDLVEVAS